MSAPHARRLLWALPFALLAACTPGGGSIYYTLEHETKVVNSSLPDTLTVFDVTGASGGPYYAAAGKIYVSTGVTASGVTWNVDTYVTPPEAGALCNALVAYPPGTPTSLFGGFATSSGNLGLYQSTGGFPNAPTGWTSVPALAGKQILRLTADAGGTTLVAIAATPGALSTFTYDVYASSDDGATFTDALAGQTNPINDVTYAGGGLTRWFATEGTTLYATAGAALSDAAPLAAVTMNGVTIASGDVLHDVYWDGAKLYVSSKLGHVFSSTDGTNWSVLTADQVSGAYPSFLAITGPIGTSILAGSDGYGYYTVSSALTRMTDTTIALYYDSIRRFFLDGTTRVFAGTAGGGLWRGEISTTGAITWSLE
jgi:hypothetical protein